MMTDQEKADAVVNAMSVLRFYHTRWFSGNVDHLEWRRGAMFAVYTNGRRTRAPLGLEKALMFVREGHWRMESGER
jgi:hypothetical protein